MKLNALEIFVNIHVLLSLVVKLMHMWPIRHVGGVIHVQEKIIRWLLPANSAVASGACRFSTTILLDLHSNHLSSGSSDVRRLLAGSLQHQAAVKSAFLSVLHGCISM